VVLGSRGLRGAAVAPSGGSISPSASASASESTGPSAAAVTAIEIPEGIGMGSEPEQVTLQQPGSYTFSNFLPRTTFTVNDGRWHAALDNPDLFGLMRSNNDSLGYVQPDELEGTLTGAYVQVVYEEPCIDSNTILLDPSAHAFIEWLQAHPLLTSTTPEPTSVGGYPALAIEIEQAAPPEDCDYTGLDPRYVGKVFLFPLGETSRVQPSMWLAPGEKMRVVVLDVGDRPITLLIVSPTVAEYGDIQNAAGELLETLQIDP